MSSPLRVPQQSYNRDSTASTGSNGGLAAIGSMLASPYAEPKVVNNADHYATARDRPGRVLSYSGEIEAGSVYSDDSSAIIAFDRPTPSPNDLQARIAKQSNDNRRPSTVVHFPEPTLISPVRANEPIRPPPRQHQQGPQRPQIQIPQSPQRPAAGSHYNIPTLPCTGTPVSPHLALPPFESPRAPFAASASPRRGSISTINSATSESIRAFDMMKEKKALFREGEEELISPFRQESGPRPNARRGPRPMTDFFWKRFSVSVRQDETGKESEWLAITQTKRKNIRWLAISVIFLILVIVAAIVVVVVLVSQHKSASISSSSSAKTTGTSTATSAKSSSTSS